MLIVHLPRNHSFLNLTKALCGKAIRECLAEVSVFCVFKPLVVADTELPVQNKVLFVSINRTNRKKFPSKIGWWLDKHTWVEYMRNNAMYSSHNDSIQIKSRNKNFETQFSKSSVSCPIDLNGGMKHMLTATIICLLGSKAHPFCGEPFIILF